MKFSTAACFALTLSVSAAFAPQQTMARNSALQADTATKTYSFTKSEEIFQEAKEVSSCVCVCVVDVNVGYVHSLS